MGVTNMKEQLPILKSVIKWFSKESADVDSLIFRLHHQISTYFILIGFIFTVIENYIDSKTITCHSSSQLPKYAHAFCWIHGAAYVQEHLQGRATGCYVDPKKVDIHDDFLITSYYLWLPYLLSFLFTMSKLPHSIWKRYFENNLLSSILGGMDGADVREHTEGGEEDDGEFDDNKWKKKKKNKNKNQKQIMMMNPVMIGKSYVYLREDGGKYNQYLFNFLMMEASNLLTLLIQILVTHWILNYKFLYYGARVLQYLTVYGEYWKRGENLHNPMCEIFPTEVSCNIRYGGATGGLDKVNYLCILQNNLFNQKYFFILWLWWIFLFVFTGVAVFFRLLRLPWKTFSRYLVGRKLHGNSDMLNQMKSANSGDFFMLELLIDRHKNNPQKINELLKEIERVWLVCVENRRDV